MPSGMATVHVAMRIPDTELKRVVEYQNHLTRTTGVEMSRTDALLALLRAGLTTVARQMKKR